MYLFIVFIIFVANTSSNELSDELLYTVDNYVYLLTNIRNFYGTTGIYILYDDAHANLISITSIFNIIKNLSSKDIFSQAVQQSNLYFKYNRTISKSSRQLFVLLLTNENSLKYFENFSSVHNLSFHVWLILFLKASTKINQICENPNANRLNLRLDSEMLVKCYTNPVLNEWYYLGDKNKIQMTELMEWKPQIGLLIKNYRSMYQRRNNFYGEILKTSMVQDLNTTFSVKENIYLLNYMLLYHKVVSDILAHLNITENILPLESFYGDWNRIERKWTGLLGMLESGVIDIAASGIIRTSDRDEFFDFTWPVDSARSRIYIRQPLNLVVHWYGYLKSFSRGVWIALASLIALSSLLLTIIKFQLKSDYIWKDHLTENYLQVWGIYCQQGLPDYPNSAALRVTFISLFLSALVVLAYYSAYLVSSLTISLPKMPFNSLEEFLNDGSYKLLVLQTNAEYKMFTTTNNTLFLKMKRSLINKKDLPLNNKEAIIRVCNDRAAYFTTKKIQNKDFGEIIPCRLINLVVGRTRFYSFALKKRNPLIKFINYYICRFEEHGLLKRIKNTYPVEEIDYPEKKYKSVDFWGVAPLLAILSLGVILSILTLCFECIYHKSEETAIYYSNKNIQPNYISQVTKERSKNSPYFLNNRKAITSNNLSEKIRL